MNTWVEKNSKKTYFIAVMIFIFLIEIFLRNTFVPVPKRYHYDVGMFTLDESLGFGLAPNIAGNMSNGYFNETVYTNMYGYRDKYNYEYPNIGIYAVGDSQTFGHGIPVEDTWVEILQDSLKLNVINTAVPAYNVAHYRKVIEKIHSRGEPVKLVIYGMTWNDLFYDGVNVNNKTVKNGYLISSESVNEDMKLTHKLWVKIKSVIKNDFALTKLGYLAIKKYLLTTSMTDDSELSNMLQASLKVKEEILLFNNYLQSIDSKLIIIHINNANHVMPDVAEYFLKGHNYSIYQASYVMTDFCKENGILYIDSTDNVRRFYLENDMVRESIILPIDGHNNRGTNLVLSKLLYDEIINADLLRFN